MTCSHSWLADTPNGKLTRMVCKYCGALKVERSYMTDKELNKVVLYSRMVQATQELTEVKE